MAGWVLTRKFTSKFQIGLELFRQTPAAATPPSTSLGLGAIYDLNDTFHLLGYVAPFYARSDPGARSGGFGNFHRAVAGAA